MNSTEIGQLFRFYRRYYTAGSFDDFRETIEDEFSKIPAEIYKAALKKWIKSKKGKFPPTVLELKDNIWKIKILLESEIEQSQKNHEWNEKYYGKTEVIHSEADEVMLMFGGGSEFDSEDVVVMHDTKKPELSPAEMEYYTRLYEVLVDGLRGHNEEFESNSIQSYLPILTQYRRETFK